VRQETNYTCGPAALKAALAWYGHEADEASLADRMDTTEKDGTTIENMVLVARSYGLDAQAHEYLTVDDIVDIIERGDVVIVVLQAWHAPEPSTYEDRWTDGHYVIPVAVDGDRIEFEDPAVSGQRAMLSTDELLKRWHSIDEGTTLHRAGIVLHGLATALASPLLGTPTNMG